MTNNKNNSYYEIITIFGILGILLLIIAKPDLAKLAKSLFSEETKYNGEFLKTIFTGLGVIGIGIGVYLNARRTKALEDQNIISRLGEVNERFKSSIELLGNKSNTKTLGAIHSLHRIAIEEESYRPIVLEILIGYIKDNRNKSNLELKTPIPITIQTIIDVLFKQEALKLYIYDEINFSNCNLNGADFRNADIRYCDFTEADLSNTRFESTAYTGCTFYKTILFSSDLQGSINTDSTHQYPDSKDNSHEFIDIEEETL